MAVKNLFPKQQHDVTSTNFRFTTAHGTSLQTLLTVSSGQENEMRITSIIINNLEATSRVVYFYINDGTDDVYIGSSGTILGAVSPVNGRVDVVANRLTPLLDRVVVNDGVAELTLVPGEILKAKINTAVTSNNNVFINILRRNFARNA